MAYTTLSIRVDLAKKLKAAKEPGESYSDLLQRLLDNAPTGDVQDVLRSLEPLVGRGVFTPEERERLKERHQPGSHRKRRRAAA